MSDTIEQSRSTATVDRGAHGRLVVRLAALAVLGTAFWLLTLLFGSSTAHAATPNHPVKAHDSALTRHTHGLVGNLLGRVVTPAAKPVVASVRQVAKPVAKTVAKTVVKPVMKTVVKTVVTPAAKAVVTPVVTSVVKPVVSATVTPVVRMVVRPVVSTVVAPVVHAVTAGATPVLDEVVGTAAGAIANRPTVPVAAEPTAAAAPDAGRLTRHLAAASAPTVQRVVGQVTERSVASGDAPRTAVAVTARSASTGDVPRSPGDPTHEFDPSGLVGGCAGGSGAGGSGAGGGAGANALLCEGAAPRVHLLAAPAGAGSDLTPASLAQPTSSSPD